MLILGRKIGEKVMIGDNITVSFLGINGTQIRLGFDAPEGIPIHRQEIFEKIHKNNEKIETTEEKE